MARMTQPPNRRQPSVQLPTQPSQSPVVQPSKQAARLMPKQTKLATSRWHIGKEDFVAAFDEKMWKSERFLRALSTAMQDGLEWDTVLRETTRVAIDRRSDKPKAALWKPEDVERALADLHSTRSGAIDISSDSDSDSDEEDIDSDDHTDQDGGSPSHNTTRSEDRDRAGDGRGNDQRSQQSTNEIEHNQTSRSVADSASPLMPSPGSMPSPSMPPPYSTPELYPLPALNSLHPTPRSARHTENIEISAQDGMRQSQASPHLVNGFCGQFFSSTVSTNILASEVIPQRHEPANTMAPTSLASPGPPTGTSHLQQDNHGPPVAHDPAILTPARPSRGTWSLRAASPLATSFFRSSAPRLLPETPAPERNVISKRVGFEAFEEAVSSQQSKRRRRSFSAPPALKTPFRKQLHALQQEENDAWNSPQRSASSSNHEMIFTEPCSNLLASWSEEQVQATLANVETSREVVEAQRARLTHLQDSQAEYNATIETCTQSLALLIAEASTLEAKYTRYPKILQALQPPLMAEVQRTKIELEEASIGLERATDDLKIANVSFNSASLAFDTARARLRDLHGISARILKTVATAVSTMEAQLQLP